MGPLADLRVVALAGLGPGPFASMLLADLGASVVRIVRPGSAEADGWTVPAEIDVVNRGVRSVELDLKDPAGRTAAMTLAGKADVFLEGFRPGAVERLGLGPDVLLELNSRLVYARLTGYGQEGPLSGRPGHDINFVAQSGLLHSLARAGHAPTPPLNLLGDYAGGGAMAAFGILGAVLEARRTGEGQVIDAAMLDGIALLTAKLQGLRARGEHDAALGLSYLDGGAPFYTTYVCSDGKHLVVGALEEKFYEAFLSGLGAESEGWPARDDPSSWPRLRSLIADVLIRRSRDEWTEVFAQDACVSPVLDFDEAAQDPHNAARRVYVDRGGILHPGPAPRFLRHAAAVPEATSFGLLSSEELGRMWTSAPSNTAVSLG